LRGRLGATYSLEEAVEAIRHVLRDGDKRIGRIVIRVKEIPVPAAEPPPGVQMGVLSPAASVPGSPVSAVPTEPAANEAPAAAASQETSAKGAA
jgi:hypothetical protein